MIARSMGMWAHRIYSSLALIECISRSQADFGTLTKSFIRSNQVTFQTQGTALSDWVELLLSNDDFQNCTYRNVGSAGARIRQVLCMPIKW